MEPAHTYPPKRYMLFELVPHLAADYATSTWEPPLACSPSWRPRYRWMRRTSQTSRYPGPPLLEWITAHSTSSQTLIHQRRHRLRQATATANANATANAAVAATTANAAIAATTTTIAITITTTTTTTTTSNRRPRLKWYASAPASRRRQPALKL